MKKWVKWLILLAAVVTLGCGARKEPSPVKLVSSITVICENHGSTSRRYYNTDEKMRLILYHIRSIGIRDTPQQDPENMIAPTIHITLTFSDGSTKIYLHKGDRYFREGSDPWREINPEKTAGLYQLIQLMPSDEEGPHLLRPHPTMIPRFTDLIG